MSRRPKRRPVRVGILRSAETKAAAGLSISRQIEQLGLGLELPIESERPADLEFRLPMPPSVNRYFRTIVYPPKTDAIRARIEKHGFDGLYQWLRKHTHQREEVGEEGAIYREAVALQLRTLRREFGENDVAAVFGYMPAQLRRPDMDNRFKCMLDTIEYARIVDDDAQFADYRITRCNPVPGGAIDVRLWDIGDNWRKK